MRESYHSADWIMTRNLRPQRYTSVIPAAAGKPRDFSGTAQVTARSRDENRGAPAARVRSPSFRHGSPSSWAPRHSLGAQPLLASCSHSFLRHPWGSQQLGGFRTAMLGTGACPPRWLPGLGFCCGNYLLLQQPDSSHRMGVGGNSNWFISLIYGLQ